MELWSLQTLVFTLVVILFLLAFRPSLRAFCGATNTCLLIGRRR